MIGIWIWRVQQCRWEFRATIVSVPMIGIWIWRALSVSVPCPEITGFSPDDRDLDLARMYPIWIKQAAFLGFSPDDRDLDLARRFDLSPIMDSSGFSPDDRDLDLARCNAHCT